MSWERNNHLVLTTHLNEVPTKSPIFYSGVSQLGENFEPESQFKAEVSKWRRLSFLTSTLGELSLQTLSLYTLSLSLNPPELSNHFPEPTRELWGGEKKERWEGSLPCLSSLRHYFWFGNSLRKDSALLLLVPADMTAFSLIKMFFWLCLPLKWPSIYFS